MDLIQKKNIKINAGNSGTLSKINFRFISKFKKKLKL